MSTHCLVLRARRILTPALVTVLSFANAKAAFAQDATPPQPEATPEATPAAPSPSTAPAPVPGQAAPAASPPAGGEGAPKEEKPSVKVTPTGYVEAYYAYNLNRPSNGITNFRGYDNRHDTFTLSNVALGASFEGGPMTAKLILHVGSTPSTYYLGEPSLAGAGGANATGAELWKYIQEAHVGYKAPVGRGLLLEGGVFPSPVGIEVFAVKDNWNWSRSNLFYALPAYHTGVRATYEWTAELSSAFAVFNGWNSVVDDNEEKSVMAMTTYKLPDKVLVQALYFGGVERATGSPEGPNWRHLFDLFGQYDATTWLSFAGQADYGWEPTRMGTARWAAGAAYARFKPFDGVYVALRGDRFHEHVATDAGGRSSSPLFWGGAEWVSSGTATVDVRPHDQLSVRLEYRHDAAEAPLFFGRNVQGDGTPQAPYVANAKTQDTILLGGTAWF